jgi:hypothetical protein
MDGMRYRSVVSLSTSAIWAAVSIFTVPPSLVFSPQWPSYAGFAGRKLLQGRKSGKNFEHRVTAGCQLPMDY